MSVIEGLRRQLEEAPVGAPIVFTQFDANRLLGAIATIEQARSKLASQVAKPLCMNCSWWRPTYGFPGNENSDGACRRRGPGTSNIVTTDSYRAHQAIWPQTAGGEWCGEHEMRVMPKDDE